MRFVAALLGLEATLLAAPVCAQPAEPSARTLAVDMFDAGDALVASGRIREACPKYAESYRLDPQLGALLHWADCLEQDRKLASAYAAFRDAAELAARAGDQRRDFALARVRLLEPRLSRVIIETPNTPLPPKATIQLDSVRILASGLGVGVALDPGEHSLRVSAPGYESFSRKFTVAGEGQLQRLEIPPLAQISRPAPVLASAPAPILVQSPAPERRGVSQKWIGVGVGGAGVVAMGVSAVFFANMAHLLNEREELCPRSPCSAGTDRSRVRALESDARTAEAWAIGLSLSGLLAAAAGAVLYFSSPSERASLQSLHSHSAQAGSFPGVQWHF